MAQYQTYAPNDPNSMNSYGTGDNDQKQVVDYLVVSDTLNKIRDQMNNQFTNLSHNVELQLADLKKQLEREKLIGKQLKNELNITTEYLNLFQKETSSKTSDLREVNALFLNKNLHDNIINNLLNKITARHQQFELNLQNNNYNELQQVIKVNKEWQNEINKILQLIATSPSRSEFNAILDELRNRTNDLNQITSSNINIDNIIDASEERHAAQTGDNMSSYKSPGIITDINVINDNNNWDNQLNDIKNVKNNNLNKLIQTNNAYMNELNGRNNDLGTFNQILNVKNDIKNNNNNKFQTKSQKKKEKSKIKSMQHQKQKNLINGVQQRHNDNEMQLQNVTNSNDDKFQQFVNNDKNWKDKFDQQTTQIIGT